MLKMLLICGPNGAGKSTFRQSAALDEELPVIDPDRLAREGGLSPVAAGKAAATRARQYITSGVSFARESTLTANLDFDLVRLANAAGFKVELVFIGLSSSALAIERVAERVAKGGHDVPRGDVARRYERGLSRLAEMIGAVDLARIYDNTQRGYRLLLVVEGGKVRAQIASPLPEWLSQALAVDEEA